MPAFSPMRLAVTLPDFIAATKVFKKRKWKLDEACLAFENGYLSIEAGEVGIVMHADGEWTGRCYFEPAVLVALAQMPPSTGPVHFAFADGRLLIGSIMIHARWVASRTSTSGQVESPTLLDLLAISEVAPRSQAMHPLLRQQIRTAKAQAKRRIAGAVKKLEGLGITEHDLEVLLKTKIDECCRAGVLDLNPKES